MSTLTDPRTRTRMFQEAVSCAIAKRPELFAAVTMRLQPAMPGTVYLAQFKILEGFRHQGFGHEILDLLCQLADHHHVDMTLIPKPAPTEDPNMGLDLNGLLAWYARQGFAPDGLHLWRRPWHAAGHATDVVCGSTTN